MSETVLITIIGTAGTIITAVLGLLVHDVKKVKKDAAVAKEQTANSHDINLRDDIDSKHGEMLRRLDSQDTHNKLVLGMVRQLTESDGNQWAAIERLRKTSRRRWL